MNKRFLFWKQGVQLLKYAALQYNSGYLLLNSTSTFTKIGKIHFIFSRSYVHVYRHNICMTHNIHSYILYIIIMIHMNKITAREHAVCRDENIWLIYTYDEEGTGMHNNQKHWPMSDAVEPMGS